jgi:hypothetical protein
MDIEALMAMTVEELRMFAKDRDIRWQDKDGKSLRKADLIDSIEQALSVTEKASSKSSAKEDTVEVPLPRVATVQRVAESDPVVETKDPEPAKALSGWFCVIKDFRYAANGVASQLKKGSLVSAETHPLADLVEQGIQMEPVHDDLVREQACHPQTVFMDVYGEPVVGVREYVPMGQSAGAARQGDVAELFDVLPDGTREPIAGLLSDVAPNIEAKVER